MQADRLNSGQYKVTATGFLSLFSIVGIMFYGLPFFFDIWVKDFGWSRAMVTSGNVVGKVIVGPLFGFAAGWIIDRFGPRRLMLSGIAMVGAAGGLFVGAQSQIQTYLRLINDRPLIVNMSIAYDGGADASIRSLFVAMRSDLNSKSLMVVAAGNDKEPVVNLLPASLGGMKTSK